MFQKAVAIVVIVRLLLLTSASSMNYFCLDALTSQKHRRHSHRRLETRSFFLSVSAADAAV